MNPLFAHHQIPLLPRPGAARAWGSKAHLSAVKAACKSAERVNGALSLAGRFETALVLAEPDFFDTAPGMVKARMMAWNVIRQSGNIIWIILTRMPENISKSLPGDWLGKGYSNVVFGIAVDDGPNLSEKLSALQSTPARHRMLLVTPSSLPIFSHQS